MFKMKPFGAPPKITHQNNAKIQNNVIINVNSGGKSKTIAAFVVSPAIAAEIRKASSDNN